MARRCVGLLWKADNSSTLCGVCSRWIPALIPTKLLDVIIIIIITFIVFSEQCYMIKMLENQRKSTDVLVTWHWLLHENDNQ